MNKTDLVCGIYCFCNKTNKYKYVGQAVNIIKRINEHKRKLRRNKDNCSILQNAWNKYGEDNFEVYIIEECNVDELNKKEIFWIKKLNAHKSKRGYNISFGGSAPMRGRNHSLKSRRKMSNSQPKLHGKNHFLWGTHPTKETRMKLSASKMNNKNAVGSKRTKKQKEYLSKCQLGVKKYGRNPSSQYKGVCWDKKNKKWKVTIRYLGKSYYLGRYKNEIEGAKKYDEKCWDMYHRLDLLNFSRD